MYSIFRSRSQAGDTIVEVMIALMIIASILTGAFLLSNKSNDSMRSSQEHTEALQLLQGQIEQTRALATSGRQADLTNAPSPFCVVDSAIKSGNDCKNIEGFYTLSIERDAGCVATSAICTFQFLADWDNLGGGSSHEQLVYRVPFSL